MREPEAVQRLPVPSRRPAARRRARLVTGLARWDQDRQLCAEPARRVAVVTLTLPAGDPREAIGLVYRFLRRVRQQWLGTRYFCWLELTRKGQAHYHLVWLNPPVIPHKQMYAWVDRAWGAGRTQYRVKYQRDSLESEIGYALKYARKMGQKAYQQRYDGVPRELRTFMNQRLEFDGRLLDEHRDRQIVRFVGDSSWNGVYQPGYIEILGVKVHLVDTTGYCSARDHRRQPYRKRKRPPSRPSKQFRRSSSPPVRP